MNHCKRNVIFKSGLGLKCKIGMVFLTVDGIKSV